MEELAPVLGTHIPAHIIHLYYKYCKSEPSSEEFKTLSYTTLIKILVECPAKTKKNLLYWDSEYLGNFLKDIRCEVPGAGFYNMLKTCIWIRMPISVSFVHRGLEQKWNIFLNLSQIMLTRRNSSTVTFLPLPRKLMETHGCRMIVILECRCYNISDECRSINSPLSRKNISWMSS